MKRFFKKRWHSIPVALVSALLILALTAGGAFAAYGFFTAKAEIEVVEAIAVGAWDTWDNLDPYGSVDDVDIVLGEEGGNPKITITTKSDKYVGQGLAAGEYVVLPVNIRNGSSASLDLSATVTVKSRPTDGNLALEYLWKTNTGTNPDGDGCDFGFVPTGTWEPLKDWTATIAGYGGESGSAKVGALVLFVRVSAPGDVVPGIYTYTVTLGRD